MRSNQFKAALAVFGLTVGLIACTPQQQSLNDANVVAQNHAIYVTKNDIEFKNYDKRQRIADDPTTILWCTAAFPSTGSPLFTVPIVGKLTSSMKRPFSDATALGPDAMYGSSVEYRYGFTPAGVYVDFTGIATYCSTEPAIWQKDSTKIVLGTDPALLAAQDKAKALLAAGDAAGAEKVLEAAILAAGGH